MKQKFNIIRTPAHQRGAVLIVSLLLLLVVTILALGASQTTRLQERMVGSQRNFDLAFQAAEAGLRAGERIVNDSMMAPPLPCVEISTPPCLVYERGYLDGFVSYDDQAFENRDWWLSRAQSYAAAPAISGEGLAGADPLFYIEELEEVCDSCSNGPSGPAPGVVYYRIVSRGEGGTSNAAVVLHSTFARRFN